jgi:ADP-ribose pyrophosphatase YjhB (NUDIX family)
MDAKEGRVVEVIARGVCARGGRVLLCRSRGAANTYLPGGHVEFGESARTALEREVAEELRLRARAVRLLGAIEHTFRQKGRRRCEVNFVFELRIPGARPGRPPRSAEAKLSFQWARLSELRARRLEPAPLARMLPRWLAGDPAAPRWASTYPRRGGRA